jgi:hypothetical protein
VDELVAFSEIAKNLQMGLVLGPVGVFNAVVAHYAAANPAVVAHYRLTMSRARSVSFNPGVTVKERFKMFRRNGGMFYARDTATMSKESLGTKDRAQASRLVAAKNQAQEQPALNKGMAKVYLAAASPEFALRTWTDVMEKYVTSGAESSKDRKERAFRSRPYVGLHKLKLIDTAAEHLFAVLEHQKAGNSTHYLRRLHNFALHLGWLLAPVMQ